MDHTRILEVGWLLERVKGALIWDPPQALDLPRLDRPSAKAVSACPAVLQHEARVFVVPCPIDVTFSASVQADGSMQFRNELGPDSAIDTDFLKNLLVTMPPDQWRHPKRPLIQMLTPYRFVSDQYCYMDLLPPFHDYKAGRWPGLVIGGRFRLDVWPRKMMWAFEWHDLDRPLQLKRGEPWFSLRFEGTDPAMNVRMLEAAWTDALREYVDGIDTVTNYVKKTQSLFKAAEARRPASLLSRKQR